MYSGLQDHLTSLGFPLARFFFPGAGPKSVNKTGRRARFSGVSPVFVGGLQASAQFFPRAPILWGTLEANVLAKKKRALARSPPKKTGGAPGFFGVSPVFFA